MKVWSSLVFYFDLMMMVALKGLNFELRTLFVFFFLNFIIQHFLLFLVSLKKKKQRIEGNLDNWILGVPFLFWISVCVLFNQILGLQVKEFKQPSFFFFKF